MPAPDRCDRGIGPTNDSQDVRAWTVLLPVAMAQAVVWSFAGAGINHDSPGLLADGASITTAGGTTYYPPGYPAWLAVLATQAAVPLSTLAITLQHVLLLAASYCSFRVLATVITPRSARVGVVAAALFPGFLLLGNCLLSESLAVFATAAGFFFVLRARRGARCTDAALAGAFAGLAGVTRLVPMLALLPAAALLFLCPWRERSLRPAAIFAGVAATIVLVPMSWFAVRGGSFALVNSSAGHWFNRVVNEQGLLARDGQATRQVLAIVGDLPRHRSEHTEVRVRLQAAGLDYAAAHDLLGRTAAEAFAQHRLDYLLHTFVQAGRQLVANPELPVGDELGLHIPELDGHPPWGPWPAVESALRRLRDDQALLWPMVAVTGVLIALAWALHARSLVIAAWLAVPLAMLLLQAAIEQMLPRYSVPLVPFLAPLPFAAAHRAISARSARAASAPA